jgi:hypothetical protein
MAPVRRVEPRPVRDWLASKIAWLARRRAEERARALERPRLERTGVEYGPRDQEADFRMRNSQRFRH